MLILIWISVKVTASCQSESEKEIDHALLMSGSENDIFLVEEKDISVLL